MFQRANVGADVRYTGERPSWVEVDFRPVPYSDIAETSQVVNEDHCVYCESFCL